MKALIFGAGGQDGYYLEQLCRDKGIESIGISRSGNWIKGDVRNFVEVKNLIKTYAPRYIFNLAAISTTRHETLFENHDTIATGALNILESVYRYSPTTKVFLAGSGVQFKNDGSPISESDEFAALSPYAVARIHSVYAARYYRSRGVKAYVGYLFHHESPMRKPEHTSRMIVQAVHRIVGGDKEPLVIGDWSVEKEWTFAGDVVKAILALVEQDRIFEAVIGSGVSHSIKDWIELCFGLAQIQDWEKHVQVRTGFVSEYQRLISNPATIKSLGWTPLIGFSELAQIMLNSEARNNG
jgi:GDPmannose 4,6-dehydratase